MSGPHHASTHRTILIHSSDESYGADRIVLQVAETLAGRGEVEVWLPAECTPGALGAALRERGIPVRRMALPILRRREMRIRGLGRLAARAITTLAELRRQRPDRVYLATSACLAIAPLAAMAGVRDVVLHVQELWQPGESRVLRLLARGTTRILAVSAEALASTGLAAREGSAVLSNASPDRSADAISREPDPSESPQSASLRPRFVIASRWCEGKGHATLLAAWELAGCPGELVILGSPPPLGRPVDVPALVRQLVTRPGTVRIIGEVADVTPYFASADAVILPSDGTEGLGLVLVEAACLGVASLASRSGGPASVIDHGVSGWLFDRGDREALAELLRSLDRSALREAGLRARDIYERRFTPAMMHQRLLSLLDSDDRSARSAA